MYWDCEFTTLQGNITPDEAAACGTAYEQLKKDKFLGDFGRFLVWWRQHKDRELALRFRPRRVA